MVRREGTTSGSILPFECAASRGRTGAHLLVDGSMHSWVRLGALKVPVSANRLARICAYSAHAPEWEDLVRLVTPGVSLAARRVARLWGESDPGTVNEIVQEVFLKLCENDRRVLREFEARGADSFVKLLQVITISVCTDYFRRLRANKRGGMRQLEPLALHLPTEDLADDGAVEAIERPALIAQLDAILLRFPREVTARDRTMFWLYFRQGMTAEHIASIASMGLSAKGVESALLRITRLLRAAIRGGKLPETDETRKNATPGQKVKGFPSVVAIDNMKNR